jgi:phosphate-selective porin OprO/OprP
MSRECATILGLLLPYVRSTAMTGIPRLAILTFLAVPLVGGAAPVTAQEKAESGFDRLWSKARLYSGDADSFFQSFALSGRLQLDFAYVDSGDDDHGEFNVRRFRFGFKTVFLRNFTLHVEGEFDLQSADPFYRRLTDTYLAWSPSRAAKLTLGKHSAPFTLDGMTSSKRLLTIDRSNLTNNIWFTDEYIPGASLQGETSSLVYHLGIHSSGSEDPEFGDFAGGNFVLLTLGHDLAERLGAKEALLRVNYVDNEPDPDNDFTNMLERIGSLNFSYEAARAWGIRADLSAGSGYGGQSDLWGFYVMPFWDLSSSLQLVARYTFIDSDDENGVRFARYEREIGRGRGDRYDEIYVGLNYYWYGHKLKLQNGLQWAEMDDRADDGGAYSGWAWTTAFRLSW